MRARFLAAGVLLFGAGGEAPKTAPGYLFIVGGGEQTPAMVQRFVDLAGGTRANILVIPLASSEPEETGADKAASLRELGARATVLNPTRETAGRADAATLLRGATGVWFTGGDQARITAVLLGTPLHRALLAFYQNGGVVGGTSAGAAIMSDSMLTGNQLRAPPDTNGYYGDEFPGIARRSIEIVPGLGFLKGAIVDQHFIVRERHNRLLSVVLERPSMIGVGIDESTALEVRPDGTWEVVGESSVIVYDAREATITPSSASLLGARGIHLHVLPAGSRFDPGRGRATLPSTSP